MENMEAKAADAAVNMQRIARGRRSRHRVLALRATEKPVRVIGEWMEAFDPSLKCQYWYNNISKVVSWEMPQRFSEGKINDAGVMVTGISSSVAVPPGVDHEKGPPKRLWKPKAANKIQACFRGHMGRQRARARAEMVRLEKISEAKQSSEKAALELPADEDYTSAHEELKREAMRYTNLLRMKEKKIIQLEDAMDSLREELAEANKEKRLISEKLLMEKGEVSSLEETVTGLKLQTKKAKDEVDTTKKSLRERDDEIVLKVEKIAELQKEVDRHGVIVRRQEQQIDSLMPETEDVCLSARSFSESMMVSLRDDAIEAKEKQLGILNRENEKLLKNLEEVENEVAKMQKDLLQKEKHLSSKEKRIAHHVNTIDRLERKIEKMGGEKAAIEVTNKQNAHLLQLLQHRRRKRSFCSSMRQKQRRWNKHANP